MSKKYLLPISLIIAIIACILMINWLQIPGFFIIGGLFVWLLDSLGVKNPLKTGWICILTFFTGFSIYMLLTVEGASSLVANFLLVLAIAFDLITISYFIYKRIRTV